MIREERTHTDAPDLLENISGGDEKKSQMLSIYLPEGSVIVDRTDVNPALTTRVVADQIKPKAEVIEEARDETSTIGVPPSLSEVVQMAVAEVLRITGQSTHPNQITKSPDLKKAEVGQAQDALPMPKAARSINVRRVRNIHWVHDINIIFIAFITIVAIGPFILSSAFGAAIHAPKESYPTAMILRGDLMVSTILPASELKVNDVLLVRNNISWKLDLHQVVSNTTNAEISTITTIPNRGRTYPTTQVLDSNVQSYKVSQVIPKLGYVPIILASSVTKVSGALFIVILNLTAYVRRTKQPRLVQKSS